MSRSEDEEGIVPPEIEIYAELDLTSDGEAVQDLMSRMPHEKTNGKDAVRLTDTQPSGVTPEMSTWFNQYIVSKRNAAIAAVCARFAADRFRDGATVLYEFESDRIAATTAAQKAIALREFENADSTKELKRAVQEARQDFSIALDDQGGRQPRMFHPFLYFAGLVLVLAIEIPINFDSFREWLDTPLFATGATLVTAVLVGFASHMHGTLLRQHDYYFGPHDRVRWYQGFKLLASGSVLLTGALILAGYARYAWIERQIAIIIVTGGAPPSTVTTMIAVLASNVAVYLVGAAWAFYTHDEIPDYPSKKRRADRAQAAYDAAFSRQVASEFSRLDRKANAEMTKLNSLAKTQQVAPGYNDNRKLFAIIRAKDDEVVAALLGYRTALARANEHARFCYSDRTMSIDDRETEISAGAWAASNLRLNYNIGPVA